MINSNESIIIDALKERRINWSLTSIDGKELLRFIFNGHAYTFNGTELEDFDLSKVDEWLGIKKYKNIYRVIVNGSDVVFLGHDGIITIIKLEVNDD